ncbi:hypothetical protein K435DRAFT_800074 [Dendrothele bispora CBS 962.96]|uniref:Smr domain-containing protein n=1 Tax=Dendrothele bispora (strain CBS 962.96) TaxID=1314807 RepID=A0A4S8LTS3_DENBC|nr:hypothetical protein K435DRAFT_800074 [Dendrothele bispora CBS 962.96]
MAATLQDTLQREFCPPLDSSLVAALLLDVNPNPTDDQINDIRSMLHKIAAQTDDEQNPDPQLVASTDDTCSTPSFYHGESSSSGSDALPTSSSLNSPLGFLQAALPHVQTARLYRALLEADTRDGEVDMWGIIAGVLTDESIRELEERGIEGLEDDDVDLGDWQTVERVPKKKTPPKSSTKKNRGKKITIVDIRQQQHVNKKNKGQIVKVITPPTSPSEISRSVPDPWTQISSISTHLATLLPPYTALFFQSYFHSPDNATPYDALQAALVTIVKAQSSSRSTPVEDEGKYDAIMITLLDILLPSYEDLDSEAHDHLISDTQLSIKATGGRGECALDLVKLLRELDADSSSGYLGMAVYHQSPISATTRSPVTPTTTPSSPWIAKSQISALPSGPPPIPPPPGSTSSSTSNSTRGSSGNKPSPYQWQQVPERKRPRNNTSHPLLIHIPAYNRDVNGIKVRGSGNSAGKGGKGDVGELVGSRTSLPGATQDFYQQRILEHTKRRDEMLRQASKMWQKGSAKGRSGEVALYFAERAREFQEMARKDKLDAARTMVEAKWVASHDRHTVDLHGTTVTEAVHIAKETLQKVKCTPSQPLKIITGRGAHSVGHVSVLKPALQKALVEEGWSVSLWDAGLVVRGKRG